jgi:NAD+ kinase
MVRAKARQLRVAMVVKRSAWRLYVEERDNSVLRDLAAAGDEAVAPLKASHEAHERTVGEVREALESIGAEIVLERVAGEAFEPEGLDLVVTVGGDGTLLAASRFVVGVPVLGINSAPSHSVGFFCGAKSGGVLDALQAVTRGTLRPTELTRMAVSINGRPGAARVLNDALFCHASPAATSRYILRLGDREEQQKSSGFWIGPAAGSTAAQRSAGGRVLPLTSKQLQLVVREPYTPHGERCELQVALIASGAKLSVRSKMHDARIFFDGPDTAVNIGYGDVLEFTKAEQSLTLLGIDSRRKWG